MSSKSESVSNAIKILKNSRIGYREEVGGIRMMLFLLTNNSFFLQDHQGDISAKTNSIVPEVALQDAYGLTGIICAKCPLLNTCSPQYEQLTNKIRVYGKNVLGKGCKLPAKLV